MPCAGICVDLTDLRQGDFEPALSITSFISRLFTTLPTI